ncbi:MAG: type II toxin-antitoxin system VapC family toxin [Lentisphaeria bacterium]|nr:type II toxin-antitoxin system VapC family toxin [Lentisphaeria bacterium]
MNILLDTHVWIWSQESPEEFGAEALALLSAPDTKMYVSTVSSLEISRLIWGERLALAGSLRTWIRESLAMLLAETAPLSHESSVLAYELPGDFHRDPADRMLVATAMAHDYLFMTADERILSYQHVRSFDARR